VSHPAPLSVDGREEVCGYDFFSDLGYGIENDNDIEAGVAGAWP
jgi:hypothetical protein